MEDEHGPVAIQALRAGVPGASQAGRIARKALRRILKIFFRAFCDTLRKSNDNLIKMNSALFKSFWILFQGESLFFS